MASATEKPILRVRKNGFCPDELTRYILLSSEGFLGDPLEFRIRRLLDFPYGLSLLSAPQCSVPWVYCQTEWELWAVVTGIVERCLDIGR